MLTELSPVRVDTGLEIRLRSVGAATKGRDAQRFDRVGKYRHSRRGSDFS